MNTKEALAGIINAANGNPEPIHYKVREAIDKARNAASDPPVRRRYAVICTNTNAWEYESEDLAELRTQFADLRFRFPDGKGYVLVQIMDEICD